MAFTADVLDDARERCTQAGMDDYIAKPVSLKKFEAVLNRNLSKPLVDSDDDEGTSPG